MTVKRFDISGISAAMESGALILTPNSRISSAILDQYAAQQNNAVWLSPRVMPIDIWVKSLWLELSNKGIEPCCSTAILNSNEEFLLWNGIVEQSLDRYPLINPFETAQQLSRAYQDLSQYAENAEQTELKQYQNIDDVAVYSAWQKKFRASCDKFGLTPLSDAIRSVIELVPDIASLRQSEILLINFFQPPNLYDQLFEALKVNSNCHSMQLIENDSGQNIQRRNYASAENELRECANWVLNISRNEKNVHIGIISNEDSKQHRKLENYLNAGGQHTSGNFSQAVNIVNKAESDRSVFDSGIIKTAFQILMLNDEKLDSAEICRLLQSPFLLATDSGEALELNGRIELELFMRKYLSSSCTLSTLTELANRDKKSYHCPALASALIACKSLLRKSAELQSSRQWSQLFAKQLQILAWPGKVLGNADREALGDWNTLLEEFSSASQILGEITFKTALGKLRLLSQRSGQKTSFHKDCKVSLLSPVESIGLRYDYLWLLNFNDQNWPSEARPSPFLPNSLQRELCIPGASSTIQRENAQIQLDILCRSVERGGVASFHQSDGDQSFRPSYFILQFPFQENDISTEQAVTMEMSGQNPVESIEESGALSLREIEQPRGGHSIISDQSNCPFRAFANHRLNASVLENFEHGLSARARGTAIHIALEQLYKDRGSSQQIGALNEEQRRDLVSSSAAEAVRFLSSSHPEIVSPRYAEIEQQRISSLLEDFLAEEMARPAFTSIAWEQKQSWQLIEEDEDSTVRSFHLSLKIDRIDKLEDGSLALIDYKTGKRAYSAKDWSQQRPSDMQLQVYYAASHQDFLAEFPEHKDISALAIAHINAEKTGYSGISQNDLFFNPARGRNPSANKDSEWPELTLHWITRVTELAEDFSKGDSRVDPIKPSVTCTYCKLQPLCRIRELRTEDLLIEEEATESELRT